MQDNSILTDADGQKFTVKRVAAVYGTEIHAVLEAVIIPQPDETPTEQPANEQAALPSLQE
jgi:hypothetical protein